jgi:hypothetical protein
MRCKLHGQYAVEERSSLSAARGRARGKRRIDLTYYRGRESKKEIWNMERRKKKLTVKLRSSKF